MRKHATERKDDLAQTYPMTKITPIAAAISALLLPIASYAEDAAPAASSEPTQTVVVTGIRGSIESSIATKRNSDSIVEAVTAEDIGKLPDVSIAESLARLPGVAAQRVDGRAQSLSIRGMAPKFGVTLLNGREMVSTGDDRSFEYDQFPSELVSGATVYKTPDASLGTQGLAGTINIMTLRPLDFHERTITVNARMERNSFGDIIPGNDSKGARLSGSYIDQFANNTVGVSLGYAHLDSPNQKKYFNPWDFGSGDYLTNVAGAVNGLPGSTYAFDGLETGVASTQSVRDGLLGVVEYKPNKDFHSQVDVFSSKFKQRTNGRELIAYWNNWSNGTTPNWSPLAGSNFGGSISNITPFVTMRKDNRDDKVDAIGWNNELKINKWTATADLSYSRAKRNEFIGEAYATGNIPTTIDVRFPANFTSFGNLSTPFDFGNASNFQLSSAWWGGGAYGAVADVKDEMKTLRLSGKRELDWGLINAFDGGVILSRRTKDMNYVGTTYNLNNTMSCSEGSCAPIPGSIVQSPVSLGFVGIPNMISFDVLSAINSGAYSAAPADPKSPSWNWGVDEKVSTFFGKFGIDYDAQIPVRGDLGLQIVHANQHSTGLYNDNNGGLTPEGGGKSYTDVLPSVNLIGELAKNTLLRFGAARVVARPDMADMRASTTASVSATDHQWYGTGGNPELEPWRANSFDLSLEHYFSKRSYVAFAVFDKQVTTAILTKDVQYDFSKFSNPTAIQPSSPIGTMTTPTNTSGGNIHGWELSGALEGNALTKSLDGFGVLASYSRTSSNLSGTDASGAPTTTSLEGLSGDVWGLTAYYEKNGFQTRIAQRSRSDFTAMRHNAFKLVMDSIRGEKITDFQLGYEVQTGVYKGLGVLFQINNMFNTPYVVTQTVDGITALKEYHEYGRQYLLGLNYKL
jgi:iron complex outermembrane receptor protein